MTLNAETSKRLVVCFLFLFVIFGSVLFFWRPGPGSGFSQTDVLILAKSFFLMTVMLFNIVSYINRMKRVNPGLARVPVLFPIALVLWFYLRPVRFDIEINRVIQVLFFVAVTSIVMNVAGYLYVKFRQSRL